MDLKNNLLKQLEDENPDLIIVTGDLTTNGYAHEYDDAATFVDELKTITDTYMIPGNHDARNVGLLHFEKLIGIENLHIWIKMQDLPFSGLIHQNLI